MKNVGPVWMLWTLMLAQFIPFKAHSQSTAIYNTVLTIPSSSILKDYSSGSGQIRQFEEVFVNPDKKELKAIKVSSVTVESADAIKKNLGLFKSINIYLSMGDGSNEILVASRANLSKSAGNVLNLDPDKGLSNESALGSSGMRNAMQLDPNSTATSMEELIKGKLAGVRAVRSGAPGAEAEVNIRGGSTSLNQSGPPLYLVDGVSVTSLQMLNPKDVQSIEILKDPAETASYGVRGSNGVIIIKTKAGNSDSKKTNASLDNFVAGTTMRIRFEYILRVALKEETKLNINVNFAALTK